LQCGGSQFFGACGTLKVEQRTKIYKQQYTPFQVTLFTVHKHKIFVKHKDVEMLKEIHILKASINAVISELYVGYTMMPLGLTKI
jgi:hypothetical protein